MVSFENHYYELNRKMMCLVGIWPFQNSTDRILRKCVILLFMLSGMTAQISSIFTSEYDMNVIIESAAIETIVCGIYIKYAAYTFHHNQMKKLTQDLTHSWHLIDTKQEIELLRQSAEDGRKYVKNTSIFIASFIIAAVGIASIWPYIIDIVLPINETRTREFFVSLEYFIDSQKYFPALIIHVDISILCGLLVVLATDAMLMTCTYHACGLFKICGYQLQHAYDAADATSSQANRTIQQKIARGVSFHRRAINYTKTITDAYTLSSFTHVLLVVVNISLTLYYLRTHMNKLRDVILHSVYVTCQVSQLFLLIYPAQKLMNLSTAILHKAYNSRWYMVSPVSQRFCLLTIQRSTTPCVISVGKLFAFTLEQYATFIRASASYFMVLCSLKA